MGHCWTHGRDYPGNRCPICATEDLRQTVEKNTREVARRAEEVEATIEATALEQRYHAWQETERRREDAANAWKFEAQSKVDRAYELYRADMLEEAVTKAREAIRQDQGNLDAYLVESLALEKLGRHQEACTSYENQIRLLRLPRYSAGSGEAIRVLSGLPQEPGLMQAFCSVVCESARFWSPNASRELISALVKRCLLVEAEKVIRESSRLWPFSVGQELVDALIRKGLVAEAERLVSDGLAHDSLLGSGYLIELRSRIGTASDEPIDKYLRPISFHGRLGLLDEFQSLIQKPQILSPATLTRIKNRIAARYREWEPEISKTLGEAAAEEAQDESTRLVWPAVVGWAAGIGCFILLQAAAVSWEQSELSRVPDGFGWVLVAGISTPIILGILFSRYIRHRIRIHQFALSLERRLQAEQSRVKSLGERLITGKTVSAVKSDPSGWFLLLTTGVVVATFSWMLNKTLYVPQVEAICGNGSETLPSRRQMLIVIPSGCWTKWYYRPSESARSIMWMYPSARVRARYKLQNGAINEHEDSPDQEYVLESPIRAVSFHSQQPLVVRVVFKK
jgi:tetratricopeptide (TPR) repeat protein